MNKSDQPGIRTLTITWILLIALTAISMISGQAGPAPDSPSLDSPAQDNLAPLGMTAVAILLAATFFKAVQVLRIFLNLRVSTDGWKVAFYAMLGLIMTIIFGAYAIGLHLS